ncbi:class I SAM-dependent methyltransferase [Butyrivibrio sp. AE3003]|uniref:class I SAM-dependent methyltransferase n=1 Tax=Butyrivibrio sp. AE3003 TaxID=1496721 RepID=UPI00047D81C8|nr:class I SAM-dependent methyltransferase [Butyrivibrio sp. AE3003]
MHNAESTSSRLFRHMYDFLHEERKSLDLLGRILEPHPGLKTLDIATGYGNQIPELLNKGYSVTAIDSSKEAISYIEKKYPQVTTLCGDIYKARIDEKYDLIHIGDNFISMCVGLCNLEYLFRRCRDCLKLNGKILLNYTPYIEDRVLRYKNKVLIETFDIDGEEVSMYGSFRTNPFERTAKYKYYFQSGNDVITQKYLSVYMYCREEIEAILGRVGLRIIDVHGDEEYYYELTSEM